MKKIVRKTYPLEFSVGLLLLIFITSTFMAQQIFVVSIHDLKENHSVLVGMLLISTAVIIMTLIIWEEILFPVRLQEVKGGIMFSNRKRKLVVQAIMYSCIPLIFTYVYLVYEVNLIRFLLWALTCMAAPVLEKLITGIKNFNDFLILTVDMIKYKNNELEGHFKTQDIKEIEIITAEKVISKKLKLVFTNDTEVTIDLDEMELDAFYYNIDKFITKHYLHLLKQG